MKHITNFESFLNESSKVELADKKMVNLKKGDKLVLTDTSKEEYAKTKPNMKKVLDDEFTFDSLAGGALRVIASDGDSFILDGSRFMIKESVNEGKTIGTLSDEDDAIYVEARDLLAKELEKSFTEIGKKVQKIIDKGEKKGVMVSNLQAKASNDLVDVYRIKFLTT
jgi:hypothetical protein